MTEDIFFTPSGVRVRLRSRRRGPLNWLLLPGGPGIGSESLHDLADAMDVPGAVWMVDLPGDGSNKAAGNPFGKWPHVLVEAAQALRNCIYVGHSTGGMYLLATPAVEAHIVGLALLSSAPDSGWRSQYETTIRRHPLPLVDAALAAYDRNRSDARLRDVAVASAPWNFPPSSLHVGRVLLSRMPYNADAVDWSDRNFDNSYSAAWWPAKLPVLIMAGDEDGIVGQQGWDDPRFGGDNVLRRAVPGGGHFPWIDNADAVRQAFASFTRAILEQRAKA